MEFLLYLSTQNMEIYKIISQKIRVVENTQICKKEKIYGWFDVNTKTLTFCTTRIVSTGNPTEYINKTILHESVHLAQACKMNMAYIEPFGIYKKDMPLSSNKLQDVENSVNMASSSYQVEHEAYWMEDKPDKVKYVLQKYCF